MGILIVSNMMIMIVETDRTASEEDTPADTVHWTEIFGWIALAIFIAELGARLLAYSCHFWKDVWNVFDFVIVTVDTFFSIVGLVAGDAFPVSILRIFRLAKLARVSKVLRVFPELRLLLAGLMGSISAIIWGTLLLLLCLLVWSMVAVLFIHPLNKVIDYGDCDRCPRAYSSVMQATLTFWQSIVAGDSWGMTTIPVIEANPATVAFFIPMFLFTGMAVMNLIVGVVVSVAQQAKDRIETEDSHERALLKQDKQNHLLDLCKKLDKHNTGELSRKQVDDEFQRCLEFRDSVLAMEITEEDLSIIWTLVDPDKRGIVKYKDLVAHIYSIRNSDTQFMLAYIKYYITVIRNNLLDKMKEEHAEALEMEQKISAYQENERVVDIKIQQEVENVEEVLRQNEEVLRQSTSRQSTNAALSALDQSIEEDKAQQADKNVEAKATDAISSAATPVATSIARPQNDGSRRAWARSGGCTESIVDQISKDITNMQVELQHALKEMNRKLQQKGLQVYSVNQDIKNGAVPIDMVGQAQASSTPGTGVLPTVVESSLSEARRRIANKIAI